MSQYDPTDLDGQEQSKQEQAQRAKAVAQSLGADLKWLMSGRRGRRVVWRLLDRCGVFRSSFTGNSETFFREGERNIGLFLLALINEWCPDAYGVMLTESRDNDRSSATASGADPS